MGVTVRVVGILSTFWAGLKTPPPITEQRAGLVQLVETLGREPVESIQTDFESFVHRGFRDNGIIFACILARLTLFAQGRLELENKRDQERRPLPPRLENLISEPWPNGSQSELLARIEQDSSLAGNAFVYRAEPQRLQRLRPDWQDIVLDPRGMELAGYLYHPGGRGSGHTPIVMLPDEVLHISPIPDPLTAFSGASWLTTVTREILGDTAMNNHRLKFFEHGATPNLIVKVEGTLSTESRKHFNQQLQDKFGGVANAYKTLVLEEGADAIPVGANMQQVEFGATQAGGENRIAVAARVPSVVLGIAAGSDQATYSNYGQALQHFANFPMQHAWDHTAEAFTQFVSVPQPDRMVFKTDHIPALQSDQKQDAEIAEIQAVTIREYVDAGFTHESAIEAVDQGDLSSLVKDEAVVPNALDTAGQEPTEDDEGDGAAPLAFLSA